MPRVVAHDRPFLASASVVWELREGVRPVIKTMDVTPDDGALFDADNNAPVTLSIKKDDGKVLDVSNLTVLNVSPGENPFIRRITVADRRWTWSYRHIKRGYNIHRRVGTKRVQDPLVLVPIELSTLVDSFSYAKWSLKDQSKKWTAIDVVEDVILEVAGVRPVISERLKTSLRAMPIEQLIIDDAGDQAINRVLAYLPEAFLYIDYTGNIIIKSKLDGGEVDQLAKGGPEIVGGGHVALVTNEVVRPIYVEILFTPEIELRMDFIETADTSTTLQNANQDKRLMENVLPLPDFSAVINGINQAQGTYVPIDTNLFTAWGATAYTSGLSHDIIQKAMVPFLDLWGRLAQAGSWRPDANWAARIGAIQQNYRTTFRINPFWMDRISQIRAYRVATIDRATGQRGVGLVYSDYAVLGSERSFDISDTGAQTYATNYKIYPWDSSKTAAQQQSTIQNIDSNVRATPCRLEVWDSDQGIIHLDFKTDIYGIYEKILPSMIEIQGSGRDGNGIPILRGPSGKLGQNQMPLTWDAVNASNINAIPKLTADHKCAVILTAIPASPNDNRQFFKVIVKPNEIKDLLPEAAQAGLNNALGPVMQIRIGPGIETARVPWLDKWASTIERAFGIGLDNARPGDTVITEDMVLNFQRGNNFGGSLWEIARAAAARIYGALADRMQGNAAYDMNPSMEPAGWMTNITQEVTPSGEQFTRVALPDRIEPLDLVAFLDSSTRAFLFKMPTAEVTR